METCELKLDRLCRQVHKNETQHYVNHHFAAVDSANDISYSGRHRSRVRAGRFQEHPNDPHDLHLGFWNGGTRRQAIGLHHHAARIDSRVPCFPRPYERCGTCRRQDRKLRRKILLGVYGPRARRNRALLCCALGARLVGVSVAPAPVERKKWRMMRFPILMLHICAGVLGVLAGAGAMSFRKGSQCHRVTGTVFFVAMLVMGLSASYLGLLKGQSGMGGLLACYLVTSGWLTARQRNGLTSVFDWVVLVFPMAFGVLTLVGGIEAAISSNGTFNGDSAKLFFWSCVGFFFAARDLRMIVRGLSDTQRVVRHLWRMCVSFFVATGSFFLGQQQVFPKAWRGSAVWFIPAFLPLIAMIFWLVRVNSTDVHRTESVSRDGNVQSLPT